MRSIREAGEHNQRGTGPRSQAGQQGAFFFANPCVYRRTELRWRPYQAGLHLGLHCAACQRWLAWVPQHGRALAQAPPRPQR
jgi:hypothetical protein